MRADLTCRDAVELLPAYFERELEAGRGEDVEAHLARCDACAFYIRSYEETVRLVRGAFQQEPGDLAA
jgi:anti-sigma factor RsiW